MLKISHDIHVYQCRAAKRPIFILPILNFHVLRTKYFKLLDANPR